MPRRKEQKTKDKTNKPNKHQAGFRELMGCLLQIFVIYLLMELANATGKEIFVAWIMRKHSITSTVNV